MIPQGDAILKLLADEDRETRALVKAQLAKRDLAGLPELHQLLAEARQPARRHLAQVISEIESGHSEAYFTEFCAAFGENGDLEEAAWRLAAVFLPGTDFSGPRATLDAWGAEVARRVGKATTESERVEILTEFLGHEVGLRGNEEAYYNLSNSLLPEVIETRQGLPITLSLVYILVGRRAGLNIDGVGLPGHFVIRRGTAFFDPFHGGRRMGIEECRRLVEARGDILHPDHLAPISARRLLLRMLSNIQALARESDPPLAAKIATWMDRLHPPLGRSPA